MASTGQEPEELKARLSIGKCRDQLKTESQNLSDEQILTIRDYIYRLAKRFTSKNIKQPPKKTAIIYLRVSIDEQSERLQPAAPGRTPAAILPVPQYRGG